MVYKKDMTTPRQAELDSKQAVIQAELISQMAAKGLAITPGPWYGVQVAQVGETQVQFRVEPFGPNYAPKGFYVQLRCGCTLHRTFKPLQGGSYNWKGVHEACIQMAAKCAEEEAVNQKEWARGRETTRKYQEFMATQDPSAQYSFRPASPTSMELKLTLTYEQAEQVIPALKAAGLIK